MSHRNKFRLATKAARKRLAELSKSDSADLRDELALCRLMVESAVDQSSPAAISLLQTCAKLSQADMQNRIRSRDLLDRDSVMTLATQLVSIVADEIEVLEGHEDILSRIAVRVEEVLENTSDG